MKNKRTLIWVIGAILTWMAIAFQFYIVLQAWELPLGMKLLRFFTFFTIIGNLTAALYFTSSLLHLPASWSPFFIKTGSSTAITAYIIYVSIGYHLLLQDAWDPQGLQWYTDKLLHLVNPIFIVLYWSFFVEKKQLHWKMIPRWLVLPISYYCYVLLLMEGFGIQHPYPFLNIDEFGYPQVILVGIAGALAIALLGAGLILAAKLYVQKSKGIVANQ